MKEKGINASLNLYEFYLDSPKFIIKQRTQEELLKVLTQVRRFLPNYKNIINNIPIPIQIF